MTVATVQGKLAASGARLVSYRGAETLTTFGDPGAEFRALLTVCALLDMSWQAKLILSGEDRVRWLNGMVTNNVRDLALGRRIQLHPQRAGAHPGRSGCLQPWLLPAGHH